MSQRVKESGENVSEIERLTARVHDLSASIGTWNKWYMVLVFLTAVLALGVFFTQFVMSKKSNSLALMQEAIITEKDRIAKADSEIKNGKIAEALLQAGVSNEAAGKANERAGKADERAAEANRIAEEEKLARIRIEKQLAPRSLTESAR